jgi:1,2-phenylacetyl-CoA epoxidase catalytic subunit
MWLARLRDEPRFREAMDELWPYALAVLPEGERPRLAERFGRDSDEALERGSHTDGLPELWDEMTMVRRSAPAGVAW